MQAAAPMREFNRVGNQIDQNLPEAQLVINYKLILQARADKHCHILVRGLTSEFQGDIRYEMR